MALKSDSMNPYQPPTTVDLPDCHTTATTLNLLAAIIGCLGVIVSALVYWCVLTLGAM